MFLDINRVGLFGLQNQEYTAPKNVRLINYLKKSEANAKRHHAKVLREQRIARENAPGPSCRTGKVQKSSTGKAAAAGRSAAATARKKAAAAASAAARKKAQMEVVVVGGDLEDGEEDVDGDNGDGDDGNGNSGEE